MSVAADDNSRGGKSAPAKPKGGSFFTQFSNGVARFAGSGPTLLIAIGIIAIWAATGPVFGFNDTWQLIINTGTTIITFLMVFVIQASQNRDTAAMHLKLDELIRALGPAQNALLDIEHLDEKQLERLKKHYAKLAGRAVKETDIIEAIDVQEAEPHGKGT